MPFSSYERPFSSGIPVQYVIAFDFLSVGHCGRQKMSNSELRQLKKDEAASAPAPTPFAEEMAIYTAQEGLSFYFKK